MHDFRTVIAEAAVPAMSAFELLGSDPLQAVRYFTIEGSLDRIVLDFGPHSIVIAADFKDDSLGFTIVDPQTNDDPKGVDVTNSQPWASLLGKPFVWAWMAVDQRGYIDGLLISFSGMIPQVLLTVVASSIKVASVGI